MPGKQPVIILGGGMAALAAAYELSCTDDLRNRYCVTVYQRGWRLGGKCASGRAPHPADPGSKRVEEHGLHVWFGFYYNAFHMLRECYAQLGQPYTLDAMFERRNSTPLMENRNNQWLVWPLDFPPDPPGVEPGDNPNLPSLPQVILRLTRLVSEYVEHIATWMPRTVNQDLQSGISWLEHMLAAPAWISGASADNAFGLSAAPHKPILPMLAWTQTAAERWRNVKTAIDQISPAQAPLGNELRRAWIIADLAAAAVRGLTAEAADIALGGLSVLDDRDLRKWLAQCGAHDEAISSAPVRAVYDLCFAYTDGDSTSFGSANSTANMAAGTALRCMMRIGMGYRGAVCYTMKLGMGEAVIAPLYAVLRRNGVRFEFFHCVDSLEVLDGRIAMVKFTRQAVTQSGSAYEPIVNAPGDLPSWPSQPIFSQLARGDEMQSVAGLDFESNLSPKWGGEQSFDLDLTEKKWEGAQVVLAISVGELRRISSSLGPKWLHMVDSLKTVATQSAQLWMTKDFAGLGYPNPVRPAMNAGPEPMDVWSDMTPVVASEGWEDAVRPKSVQYVCGPLKEGGGFATVRLARDAVESNTAAWLQTMSGAAWAGTRAGNDFDWSSLVASAGRQQRARLSDQYLRANFEGSERYVLSTAGSTAARLKPDAKPVATLYLAGDWTLNGLNAGCVEAAVMSGMQAARSIRGVPAYSMPGASDW
jgi:uncharacterized protein with NAD-binding domain and iron-sulfur cluster